MSNGLVCCSRSVVSIICAGGVESVRDCFTSSSTGTDSIFLSSPGYKKKQEKEKKRTR